MLLMIFFTKKEDIHIYIKYIASFDMKNAKCTLLKRKTFKISSY